MADPFHILILRFSKPRASLPFSQPLSNSVLANWNHLQHNLHHVLHQFLYFVLPHCTTSHHKYRIYQIIYKAKQIKLIVKSYTDHNTLLIKYATHQIAESLRTASLSKLGNIVNNNSFFNARYAEFSTK